MLSGGPFLHHGDFRSRPDGFYDKAELGFGLVAEAVFREKVALEVGFFSLDKTYLRESSSRFLIEDIQRMYITTGVRRWWSSYFSTGLNFFSSFSMGDPKLINQGGLVTSDFKTLAQRDAAAVYGLDLSNRVEFSFSSKDGLFLDLRYSYSLSAGGQDQANHMLVGIFYWREIHID